MDYASELLIKSIEEYADRILAKKAQKCLEEMEEDDLIDLDEATQ